MNTQNQAPRLADGLDDLAEMLSRNSLIHTGGITEAASELRRLHQYEKALNEWLDKTEWIQATSRFSEFGMHRADVMRNRIEQADSRERYLSEKLEEKDKEIARLRILAEALLDNYLTENPPKLPIKAVRDENGNLENFQVKIAGKHHRCECGCNVFHKPDDNNLDIYECNACGVQFEAE